MKAFDALNESHRKIGDHILNLSASRGGHPIFLIEHGLSTKDISGVRELISQQLELDPNLSRPQWNWSYLPLLVVTAEVGYHYRGTGTDFWPLVEQDLNTTAGGLFRSALVRLFEVAHKEFGTARPGSSPWERHFPLIAWPIANALVPIEMQPQLARALQKALRAGISGNDPDALHQYIVQTAAGQASRRFENWLQQTDTASEVMKRLLYPASDGWLSGDALDRIDSDLRKDAGASHAIRDARRITQRKVKTVSEVSSARYVLALTTGVPTCLLIRGPVLSADARDEVAGFLATPGDRIRAVGSDRAVTLRSFLVGGTIAVGFPSFLPDAPLRRDGENAEMGSDGERVLAALQPQTTAFFLVGLGQTEAQAVFPGEPLPAGSQVIQWLTPVDAKGPEFRSLSSADKTDAEVLRRAGFVLVPPRNGLKVLGLPLPGSTSKFAAGFPVFASTGDPSRTPRLDSEINPRGVVPIGDFSWSAFAPATGEHWIDDGDAGDERVSFDVIELPEAGTAEITIDPPLPTIADLETGNISVHISSPITIENVSVRLFLRMAGMPPVIAEGSLDRIPCFIRGNSKIIQDIRSHFYMNMMGRATGNLRIEVTGLRPKVVHLHPPINPLVYDAESDHWLSEDGLSSPVVSLTATARSPIPARGVSERTGFRLIIPEASDQEALCTGLVVDGGQKSFVPEIFEIPSVVREAASLPNCAGLVDLARATVAWKLARCDNVVSDWQRTLIADKLDSSITGILCGAYWLELEDELDLDILSIHGALVHCAWSKWITRGDDLPLIANPSDRLRLTGYLIQRLREELPDVGSALAEWTDETAEGLDLAVIDAYDDLRRFHEDIGHETYEEPDMSRPARLWKAALEEAADMARLPMFKPLILPARRWNVLVGALYNELSQDDLVDLLDSCHVDSFRRQGFRWMGRSEIRALLQFWLSPAQVIAGEGWTEALARGLSDTQTTRAVRYVSLRWRLAARDLPQGVQV